LTKEFEKALSERTLVFDGAMGTMLAGAGGGAVCNEGLNLDAPEAVAAVHRAYLAAGADIVITNTFGASRVVLAEHGLADRVREINVAAAGIARAEADSASGRRFVAGELGPTSKLPTLGHISFEDLYEAYLEQALALIAGGVDFIITSTSQDPLQVKAALAAVDRARKDKGAALPVVVSVTVEPSGTMLLGTDIKAALAAALPYRPAAFGINCATGPDGMEEELGTLSAASALPISCQPNAGMPKNVDGKLVYDMSPEVFAEKLGALVARHSISLVGGCCGTTPEHVGALVERLGRAKPARPTRHKSFESVSSLYNACALDQEPRPFIVAEQTNVNGSKRFRELLLADDFEAMAEIARREAASSHALDLCVAYAGRDEASDMMELVRRVAPKADAALMIDSTKAEVLDRALALVPGRGIINSINLEDGGERAKRVLDVAAKYGAALVCLCIDESGMARTAARKLDVAARLVDMAGQHGLEPGDLIIDPLTFTLASGDPDSADCGAQTLRAVRRIRKEIAGVRVMLGVSNCSFGLPARARKFLNSAFLNRALEEGLDAAIINPARIVPMDRIPEELLATMNRLIDGDAGGSALSELIERFREAEQGVSSRASSKEISPREALWARVVDGSRDGMEDLIGKLLDEMEPGRIINDLLMPAMQEVGASFGAGRTPLPFVLHSAETMRAAIDIVASHMEEGQGVGRAKIVLATVRGDVHDIGKNLVDAILSNNGFEVVNIGIRQPAHAVIEAVKASGADAIGLSGLLVSSTEMMREDLGIFREAGIDVPVLCGGAALTESFVEDALAPMYGGSVAYCADAFAGLTQMQRVAEAKDA